MKRNSVLPEAAMEAGWGAKGGGTVSMVPKIQPYQAHPAKAGSNPTNSNGKQPKGGWQSNAAVAVAVWLGGWFLGYSVFWPLHLIGFILSFFTGSSMSSGGGSWFGHSGPVADVYPAATELRIPNSQVHTYLESYVQSYGDAALIFAAHDGHPQLVAGLLMSKELGFTDLVDAADQTGNTALLYAAARGFPQVTATLIAAGADPDAVKQGKDGRGISPLMEAAGNGHRDIVSLLLKANATVDIHDEDGNTALMYAANAGHLGVIQDLLKAGAMRDIANHRGDTALSLATSRGHQGVADALQRGARPVVEPASRRNLLGSGEHHLGSGDHRRKPEPEPKEEPEPEPKDHKDLESLFKSLLPKHGAKSETAEPAKAATADTSGLEKKIKQLEKELLEVKRTKEAEDLKSQRRIVELLEQSADKQKLADEWDRERKELKQKATEMELKLRQKELQSLEDEQRHARLAKEAHEARMEAERERGRADIAERERDRKAEEAKRLEGLIHEHKSEADGHAAQAERLQAQMKALKAEADRAEDERRLLQDRLERLRQESARESLSNEATQAPRAPEPAESKEPAPLHSEEAPKAEPLHAEPAGESAPKAPKVEPVSQTGQGAEKAEKEM